MAGVESNDRIETCANQLEEVTRLAFNDEKYKIIFMSVDSFQFSRAPLFVSQDEIKSFANSWATFLRQLNDHFLLNVFVFKSGGMMTRTRKRFFEKTLTLKKRRKANVSQIRENILDQYSRFLSSLIQNPSLIQEFQVQLKIGTKGVFERFKDSVTGSLVLGISQYVVSEVIAGNPTYNFLAAAGVVAAGSYLIFSTCYTSWQKKKRLAEEAKQLDMATVNEVSKYPLGPSRTRYDLLRKSTNESLYSLEDLRKLQEVDQLLENVPRIKTLVDKIFRVIPVEDITADLKDLRRFLIHPNGEPEFVKQYVRTKYAELHNYEVTADDQGMTEEQKTQKLDAVYEKLSYYLENPPSQ